MKHRVHLAALCALIAGCSDPQGDWESARKADTQPAYDAFLAEYPQGEYAERARARLEEMEREEAWDAAQSEGLAKSYAAFLNQYPDGAHSEEAMQRRTRLEREGEWKRLSRQGEVTLPRLREFVASYPDGREADRARTMIASLEEQETTGAREAVAGDTAIQEPVAGDTPAVAQTAPIPAAESQTAPPAVAGAEGDFRVQLGAFRAEDSANAERERLQDSHGEVLGQIIVDVPGSGAGFFRVRSAPMTREAARETCRMLEEKEQPCIVVDR